MSIQPEVDQAAHHVVQTSVSYYILVTTEIVQRECYIIRVGQWHHSSIEEATSAGILISDLKHLKTG